jgi:hypothetical protein
MHEVDGGEVAGRGQLEAEAVSVAVERRFQTAHTLVVRCLHPRVNHEQFRNAD